MIDLIDECGRDIRKVKFKKVKGEKYAIEVAKFSIETREEEEQTGFERGDYVIITTPLVNYLDEECHDFTTRVLRDNLKEMTKKQRVKRGQKVLIVGLGNPEILADALGVKVLENIKINPLSKKNNVFKFSPNIFMATGIDSLDIINMLVIWLAVDYVILIDSLATKEVSRLGVSIQINNIGITPGSAVHNLGRKISSNTLGVPCFAIGVPLMLIADKLLENAPKNLILTPKDIHEELDILAEIISKAIVDVI